MLIGGHFVVHKMLMDGHFVVVNTFQFRLLIVLLFSK